jgi:2,5-diamino-6-(ribosylamino)-4(3H)-pyrimidinone 5'-phosphate reductase
VRSGRIDSSSNLGGPTIQVNESKGGEGTTLPRVIIHNEVSLDGRVTGLDVHMGLYYELALRFVEDATLAGADTILAAPDEVERETEEDLAAFAKEPDEDRRPYLVIPDSRGRVRTWHMLRRWPYWGRFIALVSDTTPVPYLEYLDDRNIDHVRAGTDHVNLGRALEELHDRYGIKVVRTDSGGTLNGILFKEGLVDEVSVLLNASLVGDPGTTPFIRAPPDWSGRDAVKLKLTFVEEMDDSTVWLRYDLVK